MEKEMSIDFCLVEGCNKSLYSRGLCKHHYYEFNKYGYIKDNVDLAIVRKFKVGRPRTEPKKCSVQDCENFVTCHGFCGKHLHQFYRHGKTISRWELVQNKIEQYQGIARIYFNNSSKFTLIDADLIPKTSQQIWYLDKKTGTGYASSNGKIRRLHHLVLPPKNRLFVDHINHNTLDNRRMNLRYVTPSQSQMNSRKPNNNSSGVKGLSYLSAQHTWQARIGLNKKRLVKRSMHREVCEAWLKEMRPKLHGEFACEG